LRSPVCFFASMRRFFDARVGFVATRFFGT
jgi:hypothetical protein